MNSVVSAEYAATRPFSLVEVPMQADSISEPRGHISKYLRIESDILSAIREGRLKPGDKLPGQSEMRRIYNVSAITVRKAFADLINDGYLVGVRGSGTYVAKRQMIRGLTSISFSEELKEQGYELGLQVDSIDCVSNAATARRLDVHDEAQLTRVARVRLANGDPVVYQVSYVPASLLAPIDARKLAEYGSFYAVLASCDIYPRLVNETYSVRVIDDRHICEQLGVEVGYPCFFVKRTTFDDENRIIEYSESCFNKDLYSVTVNIKA